MDERFAQQLKKGVLEMLVLKLICREATYGYELLSRLKNGSGGMFTLKEGTLYPILYRLEDEGMIAASWTPGEGKVAPKKSTQPRKRAGRKTCAARFIGKNLQVSWIPCLGRKRNERCRKENEKILQCRGAAAESAPGCKNKGDDGFSVLHPGPA